MHVFHSSHMFAHVVFACLFASIPCLLLHAMYAERTRGKLMSAVEPGFVKKS